MEMSSGMQAASNSLPSFDISYWDFFLWLPHEYDLHVLCLHSNRKKGEDQRTNVLWFFCLCAWCFIQQVGFISLARTMFNICLLMQGRLGKLLPWTKKKSVFIVRRKRMSHVLTVLTTSSLAHPSLFYTQQSLCLLKENLITSVLL